MSWIHYERYVEESKNSSAYARAAFNLIPGNGPEFKESHMWARLRDNANENAIREICQL